MKNAKQILIKTKRQVLSEVIGNNSSLFKGEGYDFSEIREYEQGEDVRKIDWLITAKFQKLFIKEFFEERELNISTISLLNGSMYFGSKKLKQHLLAEIVSIIAFSASYNADMFSSFIYNEEFISSTKASKKQTFIRNAVLDLLEVNPIGKNINAKEVARDVANRIKKKSILFFIGDFLGYEPYLHTLSKKNEVIALIVRDKLEERPKELGLISGIDPVDKTNSIVNLNNSFSRKYQDFIYENDHKMYKYFKKHKIKFAKLYTDENIIKSLNKVFL